MEETQDAKERKADKTNCDERKQKMDGAKRADNEEQRQQGRDEEARR